jgi:hypothetical protein
VLVKCNVVFLQIPSKSFTQCYILCEVFVVLNVLRFSGVRFCGFDDSVASLLYKP